MAHADDLLPDYGLMPGLPQMLYGLATLCLSPFAPTILRRRLAAGKEDRDRLSERLGHASRRRPDGFLVWMHAASVGEFLSLLPLVAALVERRKAVMLTTGTLTSARLAENRLPPGAFHQFVPLDLPAAVRRFLDHWRPDLVIFAESEIWPNMMHQAQRRRVPLCLVNARMSPRSFRRWTRLRGLISPLLSRLALCVAQSEADAERLRHMGAANAITGGNLKFAATPLPFSASELEKLRADIGQRPVWMAASTHRGEEVLCFEAHRKIEGHLPGLLTIIVPRHPKRGAEIARDALDRGLGVRRRSKREMPEPSTEVFVADTLGELGLFYQSAPVAFLGGSLVLPGGGHNPIEPAQFGVAILHGPHVTNFEKIYADFATNGACARVDDADDLAKRLAALLQNPLQAETLGRQASELVARRRGTLDFLLQGLEPFLDAPAKVASS